MLMMKGLSSDNIHKRRLRPLKNCKDLKGNSKSCDFGVSTKFLTKDPYTVSYE